jgi:hypothetical protein
MPPETGRPAAQGHHPSAHPATASPSSPQGNGERGKADGGHRTDVCLQATFAARDDALSGRALRDWLRVRRQVILERFGEQDGRFTLEAFDLDDIEHAQLRRPARPDEHKHEARCFKLREKFSELADRHHDDEQCRAQTRDVPVPCLHSARVAFFLSAG